MATNNIKTDDAIFGLVWCIAASDSKVDSDEIEYLSYLIDEKGLKLSNNLTLHKSGALSFYGQKNAKKIASVSEQCLKKLNKTGSVSKIKALSYMFDFLKIFEDLPKFKEIQKKSKNPESTFLFKTLENLDISEEVINQLLRGIDPYIISSISGDALVNSLISLPSIDKKKVNELSKHFDNSYEIYKSSVKKISRINYITVKDAIAIHRHFSEM